MKPEVFSKIKREGQKSEKDALTEDDIKDLAGKFSEDKKEIEGFADFIKNKFKKMPVSRRRFVEIAAGTMVGLIIGYEYRKEIIENIDKLWAEYQKSKVVKKPEKEKPESEILEPKPDYEIEYSKDLTELYEEVSEMSYKETGPVDLNKSFKSLEKLSRLAETIKSSEKQSFGEFAQKIKKEGYNVLNAGEMHDSGRTPEEAARFFGELSENGVKISVLGLESLSYKDPQALEATKKFNEGGLSLEEMAEFVAKRFYHLLEFAKKRSVKINGLEKEKPFDLIKRFKEMAERVAELAQSEINNGLVLTYAGQAHITSDDSLASPNAEELKKYTFKEYLKKMENLKPAALLIEDWLLYADNFDVELVKIFKKLSSEDKKLFYDEAKKEWQKHILPDEENFISQNQESGDFYMIIPAKTAENPPLLTGYEVAYRYPNLAEILDKTHSDIFFSSEFVTDFSGKQSKQKTILKVAHPSGGSGFLKTSPFAEVDENGKVKKMYLPEQAKEKKK